MTEKGTERFSIITRKQNTMFWRKKPHQVKADNMVKAGWEVRRAPFRDTEELFGYQLEKGRIPTIFGPGVELTVFLLVAQDGRVVEIEAQRMTIKSHINHDGFPMVSYPKKPVTGYELELIKIEWEADKK
jgi:hypothetical protein